jgi:curli biogenesis system outer membrane secretion channel CsgG/tetratricopeptide (TPR) repeat protein
MNQFTQHFLLVFLACLAMAGDCLAQGASDQVQRRQRRRSPIESEIFLGDWWDYYNRAVREFDKGDLAAAEKDFREAIKYHPDESARARTYGVRFQEFFPRAELGAVLFELGRYYEAMPVLMESLQTASFDQTKFYLHESRRQIALKSPIDKNLPTLEILEPSTGMVTNKGSVRIRGSASDDLFVDAVVVGEKRLLIERASEKVRFDSEVPLKDETNYIPVTVYDLLGQKHTEVVTIEVDRQGPVFSLDQMTPTAAANRYRLQGRIYDRHLVSGAKVNGRQFSVSGKTEETVDLEVDLPPNEQIVRLELTDGFGNSTVADLSPRTRVGLAPPLTPRIRVASASFQPAWIAALTAGGPRIDFFGLESNQRVYLDDLYVDGRVSDGSGVQEVRFNGMKLDTPSGKELFFGHGASLKPGTNVLEIKAVNANQVETARFLTLDCRPPTALEIEQKLAVALPEFEFIGSDQDRPASSRVREFLSTRLAERGRFNLLESDQLSEVLNEREVSASGLGETRYNSSDHALTAADLVFDCQLQFRNHSIGLSLYVVDVQSGRVETQVVAFEAGRTEEAIDNLARAMALKLEQEFPAAEGEIIAVDPNSQADPSQVVTLAIADLVTTGQENGEVLSRQVKDHVVRRLTESGRFNVTPGEGSSQVLLEREIAASGVAGDRYKSAAGGPLGATLILEGAIVPRRRGVSLSLRTINVQTRQVEQEFSGNTRDTSDTEIDDLVRDLVRKIERAYPDKDANRSRKTSPTLATLSEKDRVRRGSKLIAFKKGPEVFLPNGKSVGNEFYDIGLVVVNRVGKDNSEILPGSSLVEGLQLGDRLRMR